MPRRMSGLANVSILICYFFLKIAKKEEPHGLFLTNKRYSTLYSTPSLAEAKHILNMSFSTTS